MFAESPTKSPFPFACPGDGDAGKDAAAPELLPTRLFPSELNVPVTSGNSINATFSATSVFWIDVTPEVEIPPPTLSTVLAVTVTLTNESTASL